jgi:Protein of unknown function (DUF3592)
MQPADFTNQNVQAHMDDPADGQAPARRIGYLIAFIVIACGLLCLGAVWVGIHKNSIDILQTSWQLSRSGVTTTGTVVDVEQYEGVHTYSDSTFRFFVEFAVDGKTYRIKSNAIYPGRSSSWVGEGMPIIYDPADPNTAQIDTFKERWSYPLIDGF